MLGKLKMFAIGVWTSLTTPEKKGCLKRVHITMFANRVKRTVIYYSKDGVPEYKVLR